jgi:antitoxin ParD1/3/4
MHVVFWLEPAMAAIERLTITLPSEMAATVKGAVDHGEYASSSEVIREALRDWTTKRTLQVEALAALKADIDKGLADLAEGRVKDFDANNIIERGRKLLAARSRSA